MINVYVDASFRNGQARLGCYIEHGYRTWEYMAKVKCHDSFEAECLAVRFGLYRLAALRLSGESVVWTDNQSIVAAQTWRTPLIELDAHRHLVAPNTNVAWCRREMPGMRRADELAY